MDQEDINRLTKDEEEFLSKASELFVAERESALIREKVTKMIGETQFDEKLSLKPGNRMFRNGLIISGIVLLSLITYVLVDNFSQESEMLPAKKAQSSELTLPDKPDASDAKLIADTVKADTIKNIDEKPKKKKKAKRKVLEPVSGLPVGK